MFSFQNDGSVQAIASDGTVAWTADLSNALYGVPDFQGGLVVSGYDSIYKLDGITGQPNPGYSVTLPTWVEAVWTDGTILAVQVNNLGTTSEYWTVLGIDPASGAAKFSIPLRGNDPSLDRIESGGFTRGNTIIAGDGYAYVPYAYNELADPVDTATLTHFKLLRVDSSGNYSDPEIMHWTVAGPWGTINGLTANLITNADQGILMTFEADPNAHDNMRRGPVPELGRWRGRPRAIREPRARRVAPKDYGFGSGPVTLGVAIMTGTSLAVGAAPPMRSGGVVVPVLQAQDGSFVGLDSYWPEWENAEEMENDMIAFDISGNVRWVVPNEQPSIATADGGVIGQSGITYDANGRATGQVGTTTYSWLGYAYQDGPVEQVVAQAVHFALSWWAALGGNQANTGTAENQQKYPELKSCTDKGGNCATALGPGDLIWNARDDLANQLQLDLPCQKAAQDYLYGVIRYGVFHQSIDLFRFFAYLRNTRHFYDGKLSTLDSKETGAAGTNPAMTVSQRWFSAGSTTTAITVTPGNPLRTFWQPADATKSADQVGIDPTTHGMNVLNESNLFHEAIHGYSGLFDSDIQEYLRTVDPTVTVSEDTSNISAYIRKWVLSACPIFRR